MYIRGNNGHSGVSPNAAWRACSLVALLAASSPPVTRAQDVAAGEQVCATSSSRLECARQIEWAAASSADRRFDRRDSTLIIRLATGDSVILSDRRPRQDTLTYLALPSGDSVPVLGGADDVVYFSYREYLPGIDHHLIEAQLYAGVVYLLVSHAWGSYTAVPAIPVVSPDRKRLLVSSECLSTNVCPTTAQIWRVDADSLALEWSMHPSGDPYPQALDSTVWATGRGVWVDPETARLPIIRVNEALEPEPADSAIMVRRRNDRWETSRVQEG